jgi:uncharacterized coiled-coil DUF342 family protein
MPSKDAELFPNLLWNRFNSDFQIPESDDAARVASEVKASVDSWIQTSLAELEREMNTRAQLAVSELNRHIVESQDALRRIQNDFYEIQCRINTLSPENGNLKEDIAILKKQTEEARNAMAEAAAKWEEHGKNAAQTFVTIASTVAKLAA